MRDDVGQRGSLLQMALLHTRGAEKPSVNCPRWMLQLSNVVLQDDGMDDDSGSEGQPQEEGSVADSDAEEHEFEETACTSGSPRTGFE